MTARLFVAVWPPLEVVEALAALRRKDEPGVRFVAPDLWHITLRFLGDTDVGLAIGALDAATFPAARARLGPAVDVLAERALVVPVDGLDAMAAAVTKATRRIGDLPRKRFTGHVTLARVKRHTRMPACTRRARARRIRRRRDRARAEPARPPGGPLRDAAHLARRPILTTGVCHQDRTVLWQPLSNRAPAMRSLRLDPCTREPPLASGGQSRSSVSARGSSVPTGAR